MTTAPRAWANGPSVPLTTPMRADESVDHEALAKQVVRLAKAGVGIVLLGTNGEGELPFISRTQRSQGQSSCAASHLSREERKSVIATGRKALDSAGFYTDPIVAGSGGGSAATTIKLAQDAKEAGATHSIVICPGTFHCRPEKSRGLTRRLFCLRHGA